MNSCLPVRLVGAQRVGAGLPALAADAGRRRPVVVDDVALRDCDAGRDVVRLRERSASSPTRSAGSAPTCIYVLGAAVLLPLYGVSAHAGPAADARSVRRVLRHRLLQRPRRGGRRALSDRDPRDRRRLLLQLRPHRERRRAVSRSARLAATQRLRLSPSPITGAAFLLAALAWIWIPETRNRELT